MIQQGLITVRDFKGGMCTIVLERCPSVEAARSFADFISTHTDGKVFSYSYNEVHSYDSSEPQAGGAYDRVNSRLEADFVDSDGDGIFIALPAPKDSCLDADQQPTQEFIAALSNILKSATTAASKIHYRGGGLVSFVFRVPDLEE